MCVTDRHDMILAVKVALNPNTSNQSINQSRMMIFIVIGFILHSRLTIVVMMAMWESSQWLKKNSGQCTGKKVTPGRMMTFDALVVKAHRNHCGKRRNAENNHVFYPLKDEFNV